MAEKLTEELQSKIEFYAFGVIPVRNSTIVTWGIMAVIMILTLIFVRNLKLVPTKRQVVIESLVKFIHDFIYDLVGKEGKRYIPYLGTVLIYLAISNTVGLFGFKPPTKDLNVTAGLALMSIILIEYSGIHEKKVSGYLKSFLHPTPIMLPFNILEIAIRPLALCMRLFGNIFGGFIVMELIKIMLFQGVVPVPFSFYFDIFDGLLQAYIFVFLTSLFMQEKLEH